MALTIVSSAIRETRQVNGQSQSTLDGMARLLRAGRLVLRPHHARRSGVPLDPSHEVSERCGFVMDLSGGDLSVAGAGTTQNGQVLCFALIWTRVLTPLCASPAAAFGHPNSCWRLLASKTHTTHGFHHMNA